MARTVRKRRGFWRRFLIGIVSLIIIVVAAAVLVLVTAPGGRMIALLANRLASGPERSIEIDSISGLLGGNLRIGRVVLSDAEGRPFLILEDIAADFSRRALLSAGLSVDELSVGRIELARLPESSAPAEESTGVPALPLELDIRSFNLPEIVIGAEVTGRQAAVLAATGSIAATDNLDVVDATLNLSRADGETGTLDVTASFDRPGDSLSLSAKLDEPDGGLFAGLAGLPEGRSFAVTAEASGTLDDWTVAAAGEVAGDEVVSIGGEARPLDGGGFSANLSGSGQLGLFLPAQIRPYFAGDSALQADFAVPGGDGGMRLDRFSLENEALSATAEGVLEADGTVFASANVTPAAAAPEIAAGGARVALPAAGIELSGTRSAADVRLNVETARVEADGIVAETVTALLTLSGFNLDTLSGEGTIAVDAASAGAADAALARLLAGEVKLAGPFTLADGNALTTPGLSVSTGTAEINLSGQAATDGSADLAVEGIANTAIGGEGIPALIGPQARFSGSIVRKSDGALAVSDLTVSTDNATLAGTVSLAGGEIDAAANLSVADLSALSPQAAGSLKADVTLDGPVAAPAFTLDLAPEDLVLAGRDTSGLRLSAEGWADPADPAADLSLSGTFGGQPVSGTITLGRRDGIVRIDPIALDFAGNTASGSLVLDEAFRPDGTVELALGDLAPLAALGGAKVSGSGKARLVFEPRGDDAFSLSVNATAEEVTGEGFAVKGAAADVDISALPAAPAISGEVTASTIAAGGETITGLTLDFEQTPAGRTAFSTKASLRGAPVSLAGSLGLQDGSADIELTQGAVRYSGIPITLRETARIRAGSGATEIERLTLSPGSGTVSVSGTAGETLDLDVAISGVGLASVAPTAGVSGTASGSVTVSGTPANPEARYDLTVNGFQAAAAGSAAPPITIAASGLFRDGRVSFDGRGSGSGLSFNAEGGVRLQDAPSLDARIGGEVPFSLLSPQLAAQGIALTGAARADLSVSGPLAGPAINGSITTSGARLLDARSGIAINDLAANIGLEGQRAVIRSLTGSLSGGGTLSGQGSVSLDGGAGFPADLTLDVDRARYADGKVVATRLDADLALQGPLVRSPVLSGTIRLDRTTLTIPETLPESVAKLGVTHKNAPASVNRQTERLRPEGDGGGGGAGIGLDVTVEAPSQIFVRGRGIDAEFGGSVRLTGTSAAPVASGGFDLVRGRLSALGKRLDFSRGRIGFAGSLTPDLDFAASTTAGSTTATITITGPASQPEFGFTSSPSLPDDEILALILFGRSLSDLSPLQIAQLAQAAAELTGVGGGGGGLVGRLRAATGLDDLDVRTDEATGETTVGAGTYLNDRTYLGLERGTGAGTGKATIDLSIGRGVRLRGEASESGATKGGIFFEKEY